MLDAGEKAEYSDQKNVGAGQPPSRHSPACLPCRSLGEGWTGESRSFVFYKLDQVVEEKFKMEFPC